MTAIPSYQTMVNYCKHFGLSLQNTVQNITPGRTHITSNDELKQTTSDSVYIDIKGKVDLHDICRFKFVSFEPRNNAENVPEDVPQEELDYVQKHAQIEHIEFEDFIGNFIQFAFKLPKIKSIYIFGTLGYEMDNVYDQLKETGYDGILSVGYDMLLDVSRLYKLKHLILNVWDYEDEHDDSNFIYKKHFIENEDKKVELNLKSIHIKIVGSFGFFLKDAEKYLHKVFKERGCEIETEGFHS